MQPEQANFLLHPFCLPGIRNEQRIKSIIEAIPLDKGDYRPDEISKSAVNLAWHIAVSEMMFVAYIRIKLSEYRKPLREFDWRDQ